MQQMNNSQNLTLGETIRLGKPIRLHLARVGICEENEQFTKLDHWRNNSSWETN